MCELLFGISTLGGIRREGALQHLTSIHGVQRKGCGGEEKREGKKKVIEKKFETRA